MRRAKTTKAGLAATLLTCSLFVQANEDPAVLEKGAYLTAAAGCVSCHTDSENDGERFAGGHELDTPFGIFRTPNITPDPTTGIGGWSDAEFLNAIKRGQAPDGSHYYPAFPYPSYAGMTDADALAIKAYLDALQPVVSAIDDNDLHWYVPGRWIMPVWNALFSPWKYPPVKDETDARGAYLVRHLGHCGECHTPRTVFGSLRAGNDLAGSPKDSSGRGAPVIDGRSLEAAGWTQADLEFFLEIGMLPDGDFAGGGMTAVIDDNTALLTADDRAAMARYLLQQTD